MHTKQLYPVSHRRPALSPFVLFLPYKAFLSFYFASELPAHAVTCLIKRMKKIIASVSVKWLQP